MHHKLAFIRISGLALAFAVCGGNGVFGQECPQDSSTGNIPSQSRTLDGKLIFHDGIRKWFELKLDGPQCGVESIQLIQIEEKYKDLEMFRGCSVKSSGIIDFSQTGYYSLNLFQDVKKLEPVGTCQTKLPFTDYSNAKPDKLVQAYTVDMHVIYNQSDHPIVFRARGAGKELMPWQAYASYLLTGGFVLYGYCGDGFVTDTVFGTPEANPEHFTEQRTASDAAMFDPEGAARSGKWDLHLGYTCVREPSQKK